jgi:multiple sugar transport system substrate-binding protein
MKDKRLYKAVRLRNFSMFRYRLLACMVLIVCLLQACAANTIPSPAPTTPTLITFAAPSHERAATTALIEAFHKANPDIRVQFVPLAFDTPLEQRVRAADTTLVDVSQLDPLDPELALDLAPMLMADSAVDQDDFFANTLSTDSATPLTVLPRKLLVSLLYYNVDYWAQQGLPAPDPDWSWSELLVAAEQLTQTQTGDAAVAGLWDDTGGFSPLLGLAAEDGIDLADSRAQLSHPAVVTALQRVADLIEQGVLLAPFRTAKLTDVDAISQQLDDQIAAQQIAMWPALGYDPATRNSTLPFPVKLAVMPHSAVIVTDGYVISRGTFHPEESWRWLTFLSRQQPPRWHEDGVSRWPARRSLLMNDPVWIQANLDVQPVIRAALEQSHIVTDAQSIDTVALYQALDRALTAVIQDGQPADIALAVAQNTLTAAVTQPAQPTPTLRPVEVATVASTVDGRITIVFQSAALDDPQVVQVARQFMNEQGAIVVDVQHDIPSNPFRMSDLFTTDCFAWDTYPTPGMTSNVRDVQPFLDADPRAITADILPLLLAKFQHGGATYGLPHGFVPSVLAYNPVVFDSAGMAYPSADWTLTDMLNVAPQLTDAQAMPQRYGILFNDSFDLDFFLQQSGVALERREAGRFVPMYTDPTVIASLQRYLELVRTASPKPRLYRYGVDMPHAVEQFGSAFEAGRIGMM